MGHITRRIRSYYLFARPSFTEGSARVLDIGGTMNVYNEHSTDAEADARALSNDWLAVGDDMRVAMNQHERGRVSQNQPA